MFELREAAGLLDVPIRTVYALSDVGYLRLIERGLTVNALERVAALIAPSDAKFKFRIVPKASLGRVAGRRLNAKQSVLLARITTVWAQALHVWKSDSAAREFLLRPHPSLDDCSPIDLILRNEIGASLVREVLGRIQVGGAV